jgi:hypothetical protein
MESNRLGDIEAFVAAVKAGSFTAAAASLGLTRSAVGKSIARLGRNSPAPRLPGKRCQSRAAGFKLKRMTSALTRWPERIPPNKPYAPSSRMSPRKSMPASGNGACASHLPCSGSKLNTAPDGSAGTRS